MKSFSGHTAFLFGASSGIGLAAAIRLARSGARPVLFARDENRLHAARQAVAEYAPNGMNAVFSHPLDVTDPRAVDRVCATCVERYGAPDLLINCAGQSLPGRFEDISYERFDHVLKVNLYGSRNTIAALLPAMKKKGGHIVNTSSIAGFIGVYGFTAYSAGKFALIGFSEALRSELKSHNITVSVLCPPDTDTPGLHRENRTKPPETAAVSTGAKRLTADEVARDLLAGIRKNRFLIIPGIDGHLVHWAKRLAPGLVEHITDRMIRKSIRTA